MGNLMDGGAYGLHLAHTGADGDALLPDAEKAVRIACNRLYLHGNGRSTAQRFHENLILLHIAAQIGGKLGQRFALRLGHIKYRHRLIHGNFDFFFFHDGVPVCIQQRCFGIRITLDFLNLFLIRRGRDDLDALFALLHISAELVAPLVKACHMSGIRALHIDEHGVVDGVVVKTAHGGEVLPVLVAFKQLFDALLDTVNNLPHPVFVGLLFSHDDLLSKNTPLCGQKAFCTGAILRI